MLFASRSRDSILLRKPLAATLVSGSIFESQRMHAGRQFVFFTEIAEEMAEMQDAVRSELSEIRRPLSDTGDFWMSSLRNKLL
jgi:hypothetical protein